MTDKRILRRQDFWMAIVLILASTFFLVETADIPFFKADAAGVEAGRWYNSAALVPYAIFAAILALAVSLLVVAIRQGGAPDRSQARRVMDWNMSREGARTMAVAAIMLAYIFALVPRVDFTIASALTLLALIYGFHEMRPRPIVIALCAVLAPAIYALVVNFPHSRWNVPHDDDWLAFAFFVALSIAMFAEMRLSGRSTDRYLKLAPFIAVIVPLFLVIAMAFGFRQNVPNRTGLIFKQIEYHYYVTLKPFWVGNR